MIGPFVTKAGGVGTPATTSAKGIVKLAGHLAGTADLPTIATTATPQTAKLGLGVSAPGGTDLLYYKAGAGVRAGFLLEADTAQQAITLYRSLTTTKWSLGKQNNEDFILFNNITGKYPLVVNDTTDQLQVVYSLDAAIGRGMSPAQNTNIQLSMYVGDTTGGLNTGRGGDAITSDIASGSTDSFFYNIASQLIHDDKGSANSIVGKVFLNPYSGGGDVYAEGYGGVFSSFCSRRGALAGGAEIQVHIFSPSFTPTSPQIVSSQTGPARGSGVTSIVAEYNAYADYNSATIFGANSAWMQTGSRALWAHSSGPFRAGTGLWIGGSHASTFTSGGISGVDTQEFERAIVVNVGYDYSPHDDGTDVFCVDGAGNIGVRKTMNQTSTLGHALTVGYTFAGVASTVVADGISFGDDIFLYRSGTGGALTISRTGTTGSALIYLVTGETQPRARMRFNVGGVADKVGLELGPGGSTAPDTNLFRSAAGILETSGTFTANILISAGSLASTSTNGNGFLNLFEQSSAPAAPAANGMRLYAEDDGAGKTKAMVRFATGVAQQFALEP